MGEPSTDRYGVIGYPVSHSRSPVIHRLFAAQTHQDMRYDLLEAEPADLERALDEFRQSGGKGLNVTVPHKQAVAMLVDSMSERARIAGAVNTITFRDDAMLGDNTDGFGLVRDLSQNLVIGISGSDILVLGAGGATRGVLHPLLEEAPASIVIANRTLEKAEALAAHFGAYGDVSACRFDSVPTNRPFDLVINATSAGLRGETPPYPRSAIGGGTVCYDMSYGLTPTPFSEWATAHGAARSVMGWGMLVEQAAESFRVWRGVRPDTRAVLEQLVVPA